LNRLCILLWLWKGWRPIYDRRDINAVTTMLRERGALPGNARIILLTDQPTDWHAARTKALDVEELALWPDPVTRMTALRPNCYRRLKIFSPAIQHSLGIMDGDIVMSMDADSIVSGPITPLLQPFDDHALSFAGMEGVASRIHGSLFAFRAFTHSKLWSTFHPQLSPLQMTHPWRNGARPVGSDQAWMTRNITGERLWRTQDGCYSWSRHGCLYSPRYTENACYWSFAGHNKPGGELTRQVRPDLADIWRDAYDR